MDHPTTQPNVTPAAPQNISKELKNVRNKGQILLVAVIIGLILVIFGLIALIVINNNAKNANNVSSFKECAAAGNPVMESYPRQCKTKDGKVFVEEIGGVGTLDPQDNEEENMPEELTLFLYFPRDPESYSNPELLYPTTRKTSDKNTITFIISELIKGPNENESSSGLFSELTLSGESNCEGSNFTYSINSGVLTVQFCREIESAGVLADARIKEMLTRTLRQIDNIQEVVLLDKTGNELFDMGAEE